MSSTTASRPSPRGEAAGGLGGRADTGLANGTRERAGALALEAGNDRHTVHADVMSRNAQDTYVPRALSCTRGGVTTTARRICNSAGQFWGGSMRASVFGDDAVSSQ